MLVLYYFLNLRVFHKAFKDIIRHALGDPISIQKNGPWEYWHYSDDRRIEFKDDAVTRWEGF